MEGVYSPENSTHRPDESCYHGDEQGEDGNQHSGLTEPPAHTGQGGLLFSPSLQLLMPQCLQSSTGPPRERKIYYHVVTTPRGNCDGGPLNC